MTVRNPFQTQVPCTGWRRCGATARDKTRFADDRPTRRRVAKNVTPEIKWDQDALTRCSDQSPRRCASAQKLNPRPRGPGRRPRPARPRRAPAPPTSASPAAAPTGPGPALSSAECTSGGDANHTGAVTTTHPKPDTCPGHRTRPCGARTPDHPLAESMCGGQPCGQRLHRRTGGRQTLRNHAQRHHAHSFLRRLPHPSPGFLLYQLL